MPQERKIYVEAVNVRLHNHREADYADLIKTIYRRKIRVNYRSSDYLMITTLRKDDDDKFRGTIARFVEIDMEGDWLNLETGERAENDLLESINIPEQLFPNLTTFHFEFDTDLHLATFETFGRHGSLSAGSVKKFFEVALLDEFIVKQFGLSEVTVVADHHEVEHLFAFDRLSKIRIIIERPNDIGTDEMEEEVLKELEDENARRLLRETSATSGNSLTPSNRTVALSKVAARNGSVETHGDLNGLSLDKSTKDIPLKKGASYDPEARSETAAFKEASQSLRDSYRDT